MSMIYWDTMIFVYWLEDHPVYAKRVRQILSKMEQRQDRLCTSAFTVGEVLVGPYRLGDSVSAQQIRAFFDSSFVEIIPYALKTADLYGRIRTQQGISATDSIHLACASEVRTDIFLTNDSTLAGKIVPGIQFIVGLETNLF